MPKSNAIRLETAWKIVDKNLACGAEKRSKIVENQNCKSDIDDK